MKKKVIFFMIVSIIILVIFKIIPYVILKSIEKNEYSLISSEKEILRFNSNDSILESKYNLLNAIKKIEEKLDTNITNEQYEIILEDNLYYTINPKYTIKIKITNLESNSEYKIKYANIEKNLKEGTNQIEIDLEERANEVNIELLKNDKNFYNFQKQIYYIEKYKKQFLDELSLNSVSTHFVNGLDNENTIKLLKQLGIKEVRDDIIWKNIEKENGDMNFSSYDKWINNLYENNMELIAILNKPGNLVGNDEKISSDEEVEKFANFAEKFAKRYPQVKKYEILNEPNLKYITQTDMEFYAKTVNEISKRLKTINSDIVIIAGATAGVTYDEENKVSSDTFVKNIVKNCENNIDSISLHQYDDTKNGNWSEYLLKRNNKILNEEGSFINTYITEYGFSTYKGGMSQQEQAQRMIKSKVIYDKYNIETNVLYNSRDSANDIRNRENNYGIFTYEYKPKDSYYELKYFYENFNGSEYIGTINLEEGLETHIYNKDGKPKIITWSNNTEKNITIPYKNFTAKDIYGNEIKNENGELTITTSPIYLDKIEEKYFYQAISNTATTKYTEFEEKFAEEIEKLPEIKQQTKNLKQQIEQIGKTETRIDEQTAKTLMERHFQLGNSLIHAYQNGRIETEKVRLSSMLDMLNDIGNSYEDLVTVTAKTRNADISQAKDLVKEVENIIKSNSDIKIIYPAKILEFSKDYQEKAEYINGLEEENDIKTGLIVSKNLHSIYLSNWAKEFTNIYIDEYLKNNLISENYSEKNITNQDVTAKLNIGDDTKIINNNGSNKYTFTENGEYTFEYERRGREFRQTVKVENIDKQSPKITGVEEGQVYENKIKPIIEDENLETVRLIQDGRVIDNYINNAEIKEEGMYRIEAIDKAGNKTITSFEIIENISKEYIIENNIIKNIEANTTVEQFKENIKIQTEYKIQRGEKELEENEKIATGDILQIGDTQYTLIVRGDIDKDSKITIKDLILLRQQIIGEKTLEDTAKTAGDIDLNEKIDARDIVKLRKLILTNNK